MAAVVTEVRFAAEIIHHNVVDEESQPLVPGEEEEEEGQCTKDVFMGAFSIMAIPLIVIGHIYLFDCKVQKYIPIFLLVCSYLVLLVGLIVLVMRCYWKDYTAYRKINCSWICNAWIVWCLIGSVWVYGAYNVDFEDITSVKYCNKTLYDCSWYLLTITWSILGFAAGVGILMSYCCGEE